VISPYADFPFMWRVAGNLVEFPQRPLLMGILNVTPDSFSDGGQFAAADAAIRRGQELVAAGADILDIGAESTRPGAEPVSAEEELRRILPVVRGLAGKVQVPLSIDTYKASVARACLDAGALIINDISGLTFDPQMIDVCRGSDCGVVVMHIQGTPQTMQADPHYEDVLTDIRRCFELRLEWLASEGIALERIALDPGIGFGKTAAHNLTLLQKVQEFYSLGRPILIGHSRKRFLQRVLQRPVDERLFGTIGVSLALAELGVPLLRIHDVAAHRDAMTAWQAIRQPG